MHLTFDPVSAAWDTFKFWDKHETSTDNLTSHHPGPGERTGHYRTTDEQMLFDAKGKSFISFEDYAVAVLDELEKPQHVGQRFGVAY